VVRGTIERFPPSLFLRDTALTQADSAIHKLAEKVSAQGGGTALDELHTLLHRLHDEITSETDQSASVDATAAAAFARKRGSTRDLTHIFIGAAHRLGIPARYVAGYFCADRGKNQDGDHAWAEAFVADLGWVGFDPANCACPTEAYIRVAVGIDALSAAPVRGTRYGGSDETSAVAIKVNQ
jgi:transglutaminase-like putative cysteine protease